MGRKKGTVHSEATKALWSANKKGMIFSDEHKLALREANTKAHGRAISQYDKENVFIKTFRSISEAARETGISQPNISSCLAGKTKSAGGFHWKYAKE